MGLIGLLFGKELEFIVLVFEVTDVPIASTCQIGDVWRPRSDSPFASKIEALRAIVPKRHTDS